MRFYEDCWTGSIVSLRELAELIEHGEVARQHVPRRFRVLPSASRRVLDQAEEVAAEVAEIRAVLAAQAEEIVRLRAELEEVRRPWWRRGLRVRGMPQDRDALGGRPEQVPMQSTAAEVALRETPGRSADGGPGYA